MYSILFFLMISEISAKYVCDNPLFEIVFSVKSNSTHVVNTKLYDFDNTCKYKMIQKNECEHFQDAETSGECYEILTGPYIVVQNNSTEYCDLSYHIIIYNCYHDNGNSKIIVSILIFLASFIVVCLLVGKLWPEDRSHNQLAFVQGYREIINVV